MAPNPRRIPPCSPPNASRKNTCPPRLSINPLGASPRAGRRPAELACGRCEAAAPGGFNRERRRPQGGFSCRSAAIYRLYAAPIGFIHFRRHVRRKRGSGLPAASLHGRRPGAPTGARGGHEKPRGNGTAISAKSSKNMAQPLFRQAKRAKETFLCPLGLCCRERGLIARPRGRGYRIPPDSPGMFSPAFQSLRQSAPPLPRQPA